MQDATANAEQLVLDPQRRYATLLEALRAARHSIQMSIFRCDDPRVLQALSEARRRGLDVRVMITNRAKGSMTQLAKLHRELKRIGVDAIRYRGPLERYHAKYIVIDESRALVCTMNLTSHHFRNTHDLLFVTADPIVVRGLSAIFDADWRGLELGKGSWPSRLIVSPDDARPRIAALIRDATRSILIVDHKLSDVRMSSLLVRAVRRGVKVTLLCRKRLLGLRAHAKVMIFDDRLAAVGSLALSPDTLDKRRDLAVVIDNAAMAQRLVEHTQVMKGGESFNLLSATGSNRPSL